MTAGSLAPVSNQRACAAPDSEPAPLGLKARTAPFANAMDEAQ